MEEERKKWGREGGSGESAGSWVEGVGEVVKLEVQESWREEAEKEQMGDKQEEKKSSRRKEKNKKEKRGNQ